MHFKAGSKEPKATLEIGDKTYKIFAPTVGQTDSYSEKYNQLKEDPKGLNGLMLDFISELGSIPKDELLKIENEMFSELFTYVMTPSKKK